MFSVTVLYPKTDTSRFDMDYYLNQLTPLVRERLTPVGLTGVDLKDGIAGGAPGTPQAYTMITQLNFDSLEALQNALTTPNSSATFQTSPTCSLKCRSAVRYE